MKKVYYYKRHSERKRKINIFVIPLFFLVAGLLVGSNFLFYSQSQKKKEVLASQTSASPLTPVPTIYNNILKQSVENALRGVKGSYGIVVKNLDTNEHYEFNEHVVYNTASLYKLWVMAAVYQLIESDELQLNTVLSYDIAELNKKFNIASDSAELTEGNISLTVQEALEKMITVSDNYAAMLLTQKVGLKALSSYLKKNGFTETQMGSNIDLPTTTPSDVALFFEKLYLGRLGNKKSTEEMLTLLKKQQLNSKIPRFLPNYVAIAHKTGELDEYNHDAGLIFDKRGHYLIVIMSKSDQPDMAVNQIANISKAIYSNYINKNESN